MILAIIYGTSQVEAKKGFYETYLATKAHPAQARAWLYETYGDPQWAACVESTSRKRALESHGLTPVDNSSWLLNVHGAYGKVKIFSE
jgi:hypothetical protein